MKDQGFEVPKNTRIYSPMSLPDCSGISFRLCDGTNGYLIKRALQSKASIGIVRYFIALSFKVRSYTFKFRKEWFRSKSVFPPGITTKLHFITDFL